MTTKEFMSNFPKAYIQTLDDKKKNKSLTTDGTPDKYTNNKLVELNNKGAGIFFSPNQFTKRRKKDFCEGVNAWFFEIDDMSKTEQARIIQKSPVTPSIVVETRNSYHVYFLAEDAKIENFREIQTRLIDFFGSDKACKDVTRVLRIPGFYHMKEDPYKVEIRANTGFIHTEQTMFENFPKKEDKPKQIKHNQKIQDGMDFWEACFNLDCKMALEKLSGTYAFNGESISFRPRTSGGEYIDVNGVPADAWLDEHGRIGSGKGAAPSIIQWLEYYNYSKAEIAEILKKHFSNELPLNTKTEKKDIPIFIQSIDRAFAELEEFKFEVLPVNQFIDKKNIFLRGSVTRIGAWSNIGKSKFSYWLAAQMAKNGKKGAIFSTEVVRPIVLANIIQVLDIEEYKTIIKDKKPPSDYAREVCKRITIYDGRDGAYYLSAIQKIIAEHKDLDFVIVDFCQDVSDLKDSKNEYEQMSNYAIESQKIAQQQGICYIDLSQVSNEQAKTKASFQSGFVGLKGSGHLFTKGDIVLHLKKDVSDVNSPFEIDIVKHKFGRKTEFKCKSEFSTNQFNYFEDSTKSYI